MHLTRTYRSLPRPSSKFKPSYPSNSFIESILLMINQIIYFVRIINYSSKIIYLVGHPKVSNQMSIVISYTVLIEYNTGVSRNSQTPQDNVVVLGSSSVFLSANSALSFPKEGWMWMDPPRIERGYLRCKRSILPLDYGPVCDPVLVVQLALEWI